ncbi:MAG: hypothetical protein LUQ50_08270 [Methanospirillum sp.]|uniref:hypothetical protein n=1 Tax=Methanospirillum sp. TaxID=45200 RepID=UPI00236DAAB3|nr:hypothetical protein [Methanospirillum sp.]MDD1729052.1 hypothetical protein [Methanospirillum sp.]
MKKVPLTWYQIAILKGVAEEGLTHKRELIKGKFKDEFYLKDYGKIRNSSIEKLVYLKLIVKFNPVPSVNSPNFSTYLRAFSHHDGGRRKFPPHLEYMITRLGKEILADNELTLK